MKENRIKAIKITGICFAVLAAVFMIVIMFFLLAFFGAFGYDVQSLTLSYEEAQNVQFDLPFGNDKKYSFDNRKSVNKAPEMPNAQGTATINGENVVFTFPAGSDDDFVHSYKIVDSSNNEKLFFSDFYNGIENMNKTVTLTLKDDNASSGSVYKIYAVDSWGEQSSNPIEITIK